MATSFNAIFGGGTGVPLGAIVAGQFANNASYLPCDGKDHVSATYPLLDKTGLGTLGGNTPASSTLPITTTWSAVCTGGSTIVAVASTSGTTVARSIDGGVTWSAQTIPSGLYFAITWNGSIFCAVGSNVCATSPDGITWTARTIGTGNWSGVAWTSQSGLFVVVASNQRADTVTSPDGITWTLRTNAFNLAYQWTTIWAVNGQFWSLASYGSASDAPANFAVSDDGITWVYRGDPIGAAAATTPKSAFYYAGKYWVTSAVNGGITYFSSNGLNFSAVSNVSPAGQYLFTFFSSGNFICATDNPATSNFWYSTDGATWKKKTLPSSQQWGLMAFTGSSVAILPRVNLTSSVAASLAIDTSKFRTPVSQPQVDTDRLYIKVA